MEALPSAKTNKDGKHAGEVEVQEKVQEDIDITFKATVLRAVTWSRRMRSTRLRSW